MALTLEQVQHIALLARLNLTEEELARYSEQLSAILDYAGMLEELDVRDVDPTMHVEPVSNVFRDDVMGASLPVEKALGNAPDRHDFFFGTPRVIES